MNKGVKTMTESNLEEVAKVLAILGVVIAIIEAILILIGRSFLSYYPLGWIGAILSILIAIIVLLSAVRPNDPIPLHWILLIILGILLIVFGSVIGGILILIAGIIKLIDNPKL